MNKSDNIESTSHKAVRDRTSIHRAVDKASRDKNFIIKAVKLVESMKFPAFKYQILDETRENLNVQKADRKEKRYDYPEVPVSAMKNFICDFCGKDFQSRDQLLDHQVFEYKDKKTK